MTIVQTGFTPVEFRGGATADSAPRPSLTTEDDVRVERVAYPIEAVGARDVVLDPSAMEANRAYSYSLDGIEYVAIRREDGRLDFFELPAR